MKKVLKIISHQENANQNQKKVLLYTQLNDYNNHKRRKITSVGTDVEKSVPL